MKTVGELVGLVAEWTCPVRDRRTPRPRSTYGRARLGVDVGQCARDDVDDHRPGVAVPGELRAGLNRVLDDDGAGRLLDVDDHGPLAVELDLELEIHVVGQHGAAGQRLGCDRRRRPSAARDADHRSGGEDEDSGADRERRPLPWGSLSSIALLLSKRDCLDDPKRLQTGALRDQRGGPARRRLEGEEAELVLRDVRGTLEVDARPSRVSSSALERARRSRAVLSRRCRGRGTSRRGSLGTQPTLRGARPVEIVRTPNL